MESLLINKIILLLLLTYLIKILLLSNQKSQILIVKKSNLKYQINKLYVNLNKENSYTFLENLIYIYFPLITDIKKFTIHSFKFGDFKYRFTGINILTNKNLSKNLNFKTPLNLNIITTTKRNKISLLLFNLYLILVEFSNV